MKIRITAGGIYGATGEIAVGTEFDVEKEPEGWDGRYEIVGKTPKDAEFVTGEGARNEDAKPARRARPSN